MFSIIFPFALSSVEGLRTKQFATFVRISDDEPNSIMSFWIYILRCADNSYYTGHTDNLEERIAKHQSGEIEATLRRDFQ